MNTFFKVGLIGLGITSLIAIGLHLFDLPYATTLPVFLVWATFLLIGLTKKKKKE